MVLPKMHLTVKNRKRNRAELDALVVGVRLLKRLRRTDLLARVRVVHVLLIAARNRSQNETLIEIENVSEVDAVVVMMRDEAKPREKSIENVHEREIANVVIVKGILSMVVKEIGNEETENPEIEVENAIEIVIVNEIENGTVVTAIDVVLNHLTLETMRETRKNHLPRDAVHWLLKAVAHNNPKPWAEPGEINAIDTICQAPKPAAPLNLPAATPVLTRAVLHHLLLPLLPQDLHQVFLQS